MQRFLLKGRHPAEVYDIVGLTSAAVSGRRPLSALYTTVTAHYTT